ncbi:MAG: tetratricopeptide repeat protein [Thermoanaerobaculia bacterium]
MKDPHPSRVLLAGYFRDELPSPRRRKISGHVSFCPVCQRRLSQLEREAEKATGAVDYESAFRRAVETVRSRQESLDEEARRSVSLFPELLQEPSDRWLDRIDGEPRFHVLKLCQLFQDRSRSTWFEEPARSLEFARSAVSIADRLDERRYGSSLVAEERARAWALLGNSWRMSRNFKDAEQALRQAAEHQTITGDPLVESEILGFTASLRFSQGCTQDAIRLLDRAAAISREIGDSLREGRALTLKGRALTDAGRHAEALRILRKARRRFHAGTDLEAAVVALHNLLICLAEMGRPMEAQQLLASERHCYFDLGNPRLLARLCWLEALIAEVRGGLEEATPLLRQAREIFAEQRLPCDWALGSLRLATVLIKQGSLAEGRLLLEEIIPALDFLEIQPEAGTARTIYLWFR